MITETWEDFALSGKPSELVDDYSMMVTAVKTALQRNPESTRDYLINLALEAFWSDTIENGTVAVIGVGLFDIRVRDSLIWHMSQLDSFGLDKAMLLLIETANIVYVNDDFHGNNGNNSIPAYTLAALAAMMNDNKSDARDCIDFVLSQDNYSLAVLVDMALRADMPINAWREEVVGGPYEVYRYGA